MRALIYARFSSDRQNDRSIDDQLELRRRKARDTGALIVDTFTDRAISAATAHRPGLQDLLARVRKGDIDVVIAEALDRLSRS